MKKAGSNTFIIALFILIQSFITTPAGAQNESSCEETYNYIVEQYNNGDWNNAKNASINFLLQMRSKEGIYLTADADSVAYCKTHFPQVYKYIVQSYLRLYNVDSAKIYYFEALKNEIKINIDSNDESIFKGLGTLKKHRLNLYVGIISVDIKERKLGVSYGLTPKLFIETSFNNRHFNQSSDDGHGLWGKPLIVDPNKSPIYKFSIQGYERYFDFASYVKFPVFPQKDVNVLYISFGGYITYFVDTYVISYELTKFDTTGRQYVYKPFANKQRYREMNDLGLDMDLTRLYKDRLNVGIFANVGTSIKIKNFWDVFF